MAFERFDRMMDLLSMEVKQHYVPRSEANKTQTLCTLYSKQKSYPQ